MPLIRRKDGTECVFEIGRNLWCKYLRGHDGQFLAEIGPLSIVEPPCLTQHERNVTLKIILIKQKIRRLFMLASLHKLYFI